MANQPEINQYNATIYQLETTDPVDGGVGAVSNKPLLGLANRTNNLNSRLSGIETGTVILDPYAPKASPALTGSPTAPTQSVGDNTTKIATDQFVQSTVNGQSTVSVAGASTTTLTQAQYGVATIILTGAVTADKAVVFPAQAGNWQVVNNTTGNFTITLKTAAGAGVPITRLTSSEIWCDGTNVGLRQTDFNSPTLTGTPTAPTKSIGDNTTAIATMAALLQGMQAFGLGAISTPIVSDANTFFASGFYRTNSSTANVPVAVNGVLVNASFVSNAALQFFAVMSVSALSGVLYWRTSASDVWSDWNQVGKLDSPTFTGAPKAPTPPLGDNDTSIATTEFVNATLKSFGAGVPYMPYIADMDDPTLVNGLFAVASTTLGNKPAGHAFGVLSVTGRNNINATTGRINQVFYATDSQAWAAWGRVWKPGIGGWSDWSPIATLNSPAFTGTPTAPTITRFTTGQQLMNADAARAMGIQAGTFRSIDITVTTVNLAAADAGTVIAITGSGGGTLVLPAANSVPTGATITIRCNNTSTSTNTLKGAGTDTIGGATGAGANSTVLAAYDCLVLVSDGASKWDVAVEATAAFLVQQFVASGQQISQTGYQKLPGGLFLQWGVSTTSAGGTLTVTFPTAFPNNAWHIYTTGRQTSPAAITIASNTPTKNSVSFYSTTSPGGSVGTPSGVAFSWLAIGN